jgi:glutamate-ammonia-ligase adenylyltransferase
MQAVRYLRVFFDRVKQPAVYVRLVFADPPALRRLVAALGASAFIGDALANNPELGDVVLFSREVVTPEAARREVLAAADVQPRAEEDPEEALIGALRLAKTRLTVEVALGDLAGALGVRDVNLVLTAVADASLEVAAMRALGATKVDELGLSVLAMGKLGGREISYGSDLDVIFVYDPTACPDPLEAPAHFTRAARKIIRAISTFHGAGPGYDLDARLRPSGNQGLLVTSLDAFARYHGVSAEADESPKSAGRAAVWERMALTRVRAAAGDPELGARAVAIARGAALGLPGNATAGLGEEVHRIRARVETEASRERPGVHDLKLGPGGLLDIEFAVQFLLIRHGARLGPNAPLAETPLAIDALASIGAMSAEDARVLQEAYAFLRRLELRIRVVRADASHILEVQSPAMVTLARRMKMRDHPTKSAEERLIVKYRETARQVRTIYRDILFSGA